MQNPIISYFPSQDKLLLKFRNIKGKPTYDFGSYKLWLNKQCDAIDALAIVPYSEELKEFKEKQPWIQIGGIWKDINITEEDIKEIRQEMLKQSEDRWKKMEF